MKKLLFILTLSASLLSVVSCKDKNKADDPLADSGRTQRTENLLTNLMTQQEKGYMFGHQDATVYGIGWVGDSARSDVKSVCSDFPAVVGFDLGGIELGDSLNLDGVSFDKIRQEIFTQYDRNGVVTLSWHCNNPNINQNAWVSNSDSLTKNDLNTVSSILEGGKNHTKFLGWLNHVAAFLNSLETYYGVKVPVIFRPWHEHTGSWFWWGEKECTPEQYKKLWQMTIAQFKDQGVTNAIYAYSPGAEEQPSEEHFMQRYPGDEIVDILGFDCYCFAESESDTTNISKFASTLDLNMDLLCNLGKKHNKVVALTETGFEGIKTEKWWTETLAPVLDKYQFSYLLVWRNAHDKEGHFFAPYPGQMSAENFVEFYNLPKTLFVHDVNALYLKKEIIETK